MQGDGCGWVWNVVAVERCSMTCGGFPLIKIGFHHGVTSMLWPKFQARLQTRRSARAYLHRRLLLPFDSCQAESRSVSKFCSAICCHPAALPVINIANDVALGLLNYTIRTLPNFGLRVKSTISRDGLYIQSTRVCMSLSRSCCDSASFVWPDGLRSTKSIPAK